MKILSALFVFLFVSSLLLGPVEAGLLSWLADQLLSLNISQHFPASKPAIEDSSTQTGSFKTQGLNFNSNNNNGVFMGSGSGMTISGGNMFGGFLNGQSFGDGTVFRKTDYNCMSRTDEFTLNRRQFKEKNKCVEETCVVWQGDKTGKTFKTDCLRYGEFRGPLTCKSLFLVGKPKEKLCIFSVKKNEYYYKENGKWKKGTNTGGNVKENDLSPSEITKVENRITKVEEVFAEHNSEMDRIGKEQTKASDEFTEAMNKLSNLMNIAGNKFNTNLQKIENLRNQEYQKQAEDDIIYDQMLNSQGWNDEVSAFLNKKIKKQEEANKRIDSMYEVETARYQEELNQIQHEMDEETRVFNQITMPKFKKMYDNEIARFEKACSSLRAEPL